MIQPDPAPEPTPPPPDPTLRDEAAYARRRRLTMLVYALAEQSMQAQIIAASLAALTKHAMSALLEWNGMLGVEFSDADIRQEAVQSGLLRPPKQERPRIVTP